MLSITWINPCFLDYRVPVYAALDNLCGNNLSVIFSATRVPERVQTKIRNILGSRAIAMPGERIFTVGHSKAGFANGGLKAPLQSGLLKAIRKTSPSVLIAEGFFQWTPAALWLRLRNCIPLVVAYERTIYTERQAGRLRTEYRRRVCQIVDAICCNGQLSKEYCTRVLGYPPERVFTGAMAADTQCLKRSCTKVTEDESNELRRSLGLTKPVFLFVGRLIARKGIAELLEAWAIHQAAGGDDAGTLLIVGDGPERDRSERLVWSRSLRVRFAGAVDYDDISRYYAAADAFVMPTLEDNWSLAVAEAMACGLPILCSKYNGGWPELVHADNGVVFDPHDAADTARGLASFVERGSRLREMGAASNRIVQEYAPDRAASVVLNACQAAIASR